MMIVVAVLQMCCVPLLSSSGFFSLLLLSLLPILRFVLDEKFQQNASKFAIINNPEFLFPFLISCYFVFLPNEYPGYVNIDQSIH